MDDYWNGRGVPWEHDPGPPPEGRWVSLFAETPNYRGLGKAVLGGEQFRWHFGPMFYRGRLTDGDVKVLVIGQEGAQDESLGHRSFVGGTGARMQHVLNHLGINRSYLFLNSFAYPVFGQYTAKLRGLAQDPDSPIVQHRNAIYDEVLAHNDLRLVIAVGTAAKESLVTWITSRGGTCPEGAADVSRFTPAGALGPRTKAVGVLHPGGAGAGGASAIIADFKAKLGRIEQWAADDPSWLPSDPGAIRLPTAAYKYKSDPVPFRDLPLGTCWRLGSGATSSNRKDSQRSIQLFSDGGHYNGQGDAIHYTSDALGTNAGYVDEPADLPYEPPRAHPAEHDRGPSAPLAQLLQGGKAGCEWPDFHALGVRAHPSLGWGPIHRGRYGGIALLVLADQESSDDLFTARAMTGDAGQRFQSWLRAAGLTSKYAIVRVLPVDTADVPAATVNDIVDHPQVGKVYRAIIDALTAASPDLGALVAVGPFATRLAGHLGGGGRPLVTMKAWRQNGALADWQRALTDVAALDFPRDVAPRTTYDGSRGEIARADLPYGTLRWQGSSGDRAVRAMADGHLSPDYYKYFMPAWAAALTPAALSPSEAAAVPKIPVADDDPIDPLAGGRYCLQGRVVTMDDAGTVHDDGVVFIESGRIAAVGAAADPRPDAFADAPIVRTGGTIYPGLIELHNHLSYNVIPLWDVPATFVNRDQWAGRDDYRVAVTGPMSVLGRTAGYVEAIVRYVEAKCLLSGTTTSQGVTLSSNAGIRRHYRGVVRNVEQTGEDDLPAAATHIADVAEGTAEAFLGQLESATTLLLHLSEGIGPTARRHFEALRIEPRKWAITPALAGIHCAGLNAANFQRLARDGGTMVWSPLSNLLLYGKTANIAAARRAGVLISLGSDWSPSGSKNLFGELKVAATVNETLPDDVRFTARELVQMVTTNPARILKWQDAIGSVEAGKRADVIVVDDTVDDPYERLLTARETAISMVVIDGVPRYGAPALLGRFGAEGERLAVGGVQRSLFLTDPDSDELVGALTLAEARDRLTDGLRRLPELAATLEQPGLAAPAEWTLELDQNPTDDFEGVMAGILPPLSEVLHPIDLDPILIADDSQYADRLTGQRNLKPSLRAELAARYR